MRKIKKKSTMDQKEMENKDKQRKDLEFDKMVKEMLKNFEQSRKNPKCPPSLSNIFIVLILFSCLIIFILLSN